MCGATPVVTEERKCKTEIDGRAFISGADAVIWGGSLQASCHGGKQTGSRLVQTGSETTARLTVLLLIVNY